MGVLRFGAFILDQPRRALLRGGAEIELRSQSFDVLDFLARNPGRVLSKDELIDAVWDPRPASDDSLVQCITDIRKALCDSDHRIIKTLPRRGYMFVAEVLEGAPSPARPSQAAANVVFDQRSAPVAESQVTWQRGLMAAVLLIAALAGSGWLIWSCGFARRS